MTEHGSRVVSSHQARRRPGSPPAADAAPSHARANMTEFGRFFLPGPTEVRSEVLAAMVQPMIGHRGESIVPLLRDPQPVLQALFGTARPVYVSSSSATGMMEAAVRNGVRRRALGLVNGAFSERFRDLVADCGRQVETYEVPWGAAHDPGELERRLMAGGIDSVTVVHSETSTGVLNPLPELAEAVRRAETALGEEILLLVDGVTSVGAARIEAESWGVDLFLTGSQKAMALPPGLAFATASERLLDRASALPGRGQYLDLLEFERYHGKHQTPNTPALPLLYALHEQARRIGEEGVAARAARHDAMRDRTVAWVRERADRGLSLLAAEGFRSPTVTAVVLPPGVPGQAVVGALKRAGFTIGSGYGKLKEHTIRIGHMGDHTVQELETLLAAADEALVEATTR